MIFISHNHKDKNFIGPMADALGEKYGSENVFFDSWSIRPGENIIIEMDSGIEKAKTFFFFITENSLSSKMVELEWTSALIKKAKNPDLKFIPIRAENINVPAIISSLSYLDLVNNGLEITLTQMVEIIDGHYMDEPFPPFVNLKAYVQGDLDKLSYFIYVDKFYEPSSRFLILTNAKRNEISVKVSSESMYEKRYIDNPLNYKGVYYNGIQVAVTGGIKKGFKIQLDVEALENGLMELKLLHEIRSDEFKLIPLQVIDEIKEINI